MNPRPDAGRSSELSHSSSSNAGAAALSLIRPQLPTGRPLPQSYHPAYLRDGGAVATGGLDGASRKALKQSKRGGRETRQAFRPPHTRVPPRRVSTLPPSAKQSASRHGWSWECSFLSRGHL